VKFRGTVLLGGKTATGIEVPAEVVDGLGASKRPAVRVRIGAYTYRSSIDGLSYSNKLRHVLSIEDAKTPQTRRRRIEKVVGGLREDWK
jgi:uncharacterized protein YdeI (YjbR/CyaY-like superfamily)